MYAKNVAIGSIGGMKAAKMVSIVMGVSERFCFTQVGISENETSTYH